MGQNVLRCKSYTEQFKHTAELTAQEKWVFFSRHPVFKQGQTNIYEHWVNPSVGRKSTFRTGIPWRTGLTRISNRVFLHPSLQNNHQPFINTVGSTVSKKTLWHGTNTERNVLKLFAACVVGLTEERLFNNNILFQQHGTFVNIRM